MKRKKKNTVDTVIRILIVACVIVAVSIAVLLVANLDILPADGKNISSTTDTSDTQKSTNMTDNSDEQPVNENTTEESTQAETTQPETTTEPETTSDSTVTTSATLWEEEDRIIINPDQEHWSLVVVNGTRAMPEGFKPQLATVAGTDVQMDYRVAPYYTAMFEAAKKDGIILTPYSGYRSYDRQKRNYNNLTEKYMSQYNLSREEAAIKAATVILPPGTSEHNLGLAMDICNTYDSFANQKEYEWLMNHAHEFGFILRYTAEKQPITGIVPEPWHWRFVGVEYAEDIKNSGLCLEEWLTANGYSY